MQNAAYSNVKLHLGKRNYPIRPVYFKFTQQSNLFYELTCETSHLLLFEQHSFTYFTLKIVKVTTCM